MLITAAPARTARRDRARGVRAEDLLAVRQRHVERARAGPDAEHADAVGGRGGDRRRRGAVEVRERPAAERGDVRAGDLRVASMSSAVSTSAISGLVGVTGGGDRAADHEVAPARLRPTAGPAPGAAPGDPVRLGVVEQPARAQGGGERAGALARRRARRRRRSAGRRARGRSGAGRAAPRARDDPGRPGRRRRRRRRRRPAASRPAAGAVPSSAAAAAVGRQRPAPRARRAPRAGSVGSPAPG